MFINLKKALILSVLSLLLVTPNAFDLNAAKEDAKKRKNPTEQKERKKTTDKERERKRAEQNKARLQEAERRIESTSRYIMKLKLSDEQKESMKNIRVESGKSQDSEKMKSLKDEINTLKEKIAKLESVQEEKYSKELLKILTPDQKQQLKNMQDLEKLKLKRKLLDDEIRKISQESSRLQKTKKKRPTPNKKKSSKSSKSKKDSKVKK